MCTLKPFDFSRESNVSILPFKAIKALLSHSFCFFSVLVQQDHYVHVHRCHDSGSGGHR